jgi:cysteine-rich repeat protein
VKAAPLAALSLLVGCVQSGVVQCDDGRLCPAGLECDDQHDLCVRPEQKAECAGHDDFTPCEVTGIEDPTCYDGVCLPGGCGNGFEDPEEACDDANAISGDGCAADCESTETCGNGVPDVVKGEACDDGNAIGHDGCASACDVESARWVEIAPWPPPRKGASIAYDSRRQRIVMFGGHHKRTVFSFPFRRADTWEWDGHHWSEMLPSASPAQRTGAAMAYDPGRGVTVLFGGDDAGLFGDTWEWDGGTWAQRSPEGDSPPARSGGGMAYDPARGRVVLVGGIGADGVGVADTWEWDGQSWEEQSSGALPGGVPRVAYDPRRGVLVAFVAGQTWERLDASWQDVTPATGSPPEAPDAAIAFDPTLGAVALHGGGVGAMDTWTWNGSAWAHPGAGGPFVDGAQMAGDVARGEIILFGGDDGTNTWSWNGAKWKLTDDIVAPEPRFGHGWALDVHGDVIVYGGEDLGFNAFVDTWAWRGKWIQREATSAPGPRTEPAMAYDAAHGETVMYGGFDDVTTWIWDGETWSPRTSTTTPGPRAGATAAYDAAREEIVMFGSGSGTWLWNGTDWRDAAPPVGPPERTGAALAYDPIRARIVMFGGGSPIDESSLGDTWEWDGVTWEERTPAASPPPRDGAAMDWDAARRRIVMFGGRAGFVAARNDVWEWDGEHWVQGTAPLPPVGRTQHALFASPDGAGVLVFGGGVVEADLASGIVEVLSDVWRLRWDGVHPDESCVAIDIDGDEVAACEDPDCWARCVGCGDGTCDEALESCDLCPEDCGACPPRCGDFACAAGETEATCPGDC